MAKLTRAAIKEIVKECLVEILQEGLDSTDVMVESRGRKSQSKGLMREATSSSRGSSSRGSALDNITYGQKNKSIKNESFESNVEKITSQMTSDPVLSSILADTARTTLQEQTVAEVKGPGSSLVATSAAGDRAARDMSKSDPLDIFSESSQKWAALAFSD